MSAAKADMPGGTGGVGAVRFRDCISLADANCGGVQRFDSNFPAKLCSPFGSTAVSSARPMSLLGTLIYRIQSNAHRPVTAVANQRPSQQPSIKCYEE